MDFVIVTFQPDIKLLRHCLSSYDLYYQDKNRLFIFASEADRTLLARIAIPSNVTILVREDFPELKGMADPSQAAYLKLISFQIVTTEYFGVIDSDFLFISPTSDRDFFRDGKPVWFYRPWLDDEPPLRIRKAAERFVGSRIDYLFLDEAQWVFKRSIAADLASRYSLAKILRQEQLIYGWFAHEQHRDEYCFVRSDKANTQSIVGKVNQIPPDYCHLDPACNYDQFKDRKIVVFWSYWDLAEAKMIEFFEESQRDHFGRVIMKADRNPLLCIIDPNDITKGNFRYFEGVFSDGWVKDVVRFMLNIPEHCRSVRVELMVPQNPNNPAWRLNGDISIGDPANEHLFTLAPGLNKLDVQVPDTAWGKSTVVRVQFGPGFYYADNPDSREFRAWLQVISFADATLGN